MQSRRAFTLIELLVVISIVAVLSVIVFAQVQNLTARAKNSKTQDVVREMGAAIGLFRNTDGSNDRIIAPKFISGSTSEGDSNESYYNSSRIGGLELTNVNRTTPFGPFTGKLINVQTRDGGGNVTQDFQYPLNITRPASATNPIRLAGLFQNDKNVSLLQDAYTWSRNAANATLSTERSLFTVPTTTPNKYCIIVAARLTNDSGGNTVVYYRNGSVANVDMSSWRSTYNAANPGSTVASDGSEDFLLVTCTYP